MNKILKGEKGVNIRIDDVYTVNEKHFVTPYVKPDGTEKFFGSFKFLFPKDAKETLKEAVKQMFSDFGATQDTIFDGQYAKWIEDNYGTSLNVQGRVKFYKDVTATVPVESIDIKDGVYSLEIHLTKTQDGGIFMRVARATWLRAGESKFNDSLYDDSDLPF